MFFIFDDEIDNFITFDNNQELEYIYYAINIYYNKYDYDSYNFNTQLKNSKKKRKIDERNNIINKKYKF
jgi:hypothetical protein